MAQPVTAAARKAKRAELRERRIANAERESLILDRSLKCGGFGLTAEPKHAGQPEGCRNSGNYCLCECHDPDAA